MEAPRPETLDALGASLPWLLAESLSFAPTHFGLCNTSFMMTRPNGERFILREGGGDDEVLEISRIAEEKAARALSASGLGAPLLAFHLPEGHVVSGFLENEPHPEGWWKTEEGAIRAAEALKRMHSLSENGKPFDPVADVEHRIAWAKESGSKIPEVLQAVSLLEPHGTSARKLTEDHSASGLSVTGLLHGDFFPNNVLRTRDGLRIIDVEFSGRGEVWYDLACISYSMDDASIETLIRSCLGATSPEHRRALDRFRYLACVWDATWALVQAVRNRPGHDYRAHVLRSIGFLDGFLAKASSIP